MSTFTVTAVSPDVGSYQGKYGVMHTYKVRFEETGQETIQISQKPETPAPVKGDSLNGSITRSEYGAKFKKEFSQSAQGSQGGFGGSSKSSRPQSDPLTVYVSYAKDLIVSLVSNGIVPIDEKTTDQFNETLLKLISSAKQGGLLLQKSEPSLLDDAPQFDGPPPSEDGF